MAQQNINIKNRKAKFEYELIETFVAGMQLAGTEIKSIRSGKASLSDSYCQFFSGELFVRNLHISEYELGNINNKGVGLNHCSNTAFYQQSRTGKTRNCAGTR
jgi:tmRNA-binding protein